MRRTLAAITFAALMIQAFSGSFSGAVAGPFPECTPDPAAAIEVGQVACRTLPSAFLGGTTAFSYFVPPGCDPATSQGRRCPTLYLLHGFGGDYRSMLGTADEPSAWVEALSKGPPRDPSQVLDPWTMADPAGWETADPIDFILVAPHGATLDGGFGPVAGVDGFWSDWNPRFAKGGDSERYPTPPPRFESFIVRELIPYVESHFPAGAGREWRSLAGTSLGGFGSYKNGLQHPDLWSSIGSISGAHNFLFAPVPDPLPIDAPVHIGPPAALLYTHLPSITSMIPLAALPEAARGFPVSFLVFGDPAQDQAQYRGNMPRDLAMNGRASAAGVSSLHIRGFVNDAIPRRREDIGPSYPVAQAFEAIVLPMNLGMEAAFRIAGVEHTFEIHPGIHSGVYWNPFLRAQIAAQYARVRHADGTGSPPPLATVFDYRTISTDFTIWGWAFHVAREPVEFLTLNDVSCDGLTLRGSGVVTVSVPPSCGTTLNGKTTFDVDLGPSWPVDEPAGASDLPAYGVSVRVELS
jgi:S-formylglutathione hydrolase FrmB